MEDKFYGLRYDAVFKGTFSNEEEMKRLLKETINLNAKKILFINTEMKKERVLEKKKILDLVVQLDDDEIVNIEVNNNYYEGLFNRNFFYLSKLIGTSIESNDEYTNVKKTYQINITWNLKRYVKNIDLSNIKELNFELLDSNYLKCDLYGDVLGIKIINMDYYKEKWYNGDIEGENPFFMLLAAEKLEEMDFISKGDELMEKITEDVERLNRLKELVANITMENDYEKLVNGTIKAATKEASEKAMKQGLEEGIEQGKKESSIEIAKNLISQKIDLNIISNCTGLSIEELNRIK